MPINANQPAKYSALETQAKIFLELLDEIPMSDQRKLVEQKIHEATFWIKECKKEDIWVDQE